MATSAFKSTTRRDSGSADSTSARSLRRSRSLSRFSRRLEDVPDRKPAPPGTAAQFPEISLDDLALEFFSSSSSWNENGSDCGVAERKGRQGRSVSRQGEIGRWASDTASSRRKSRSVSRTGGDASSRPAAVKDKNVSSSAAGARRRRSLSVARRDVSDSESEVNRSLNSSNRANVKAPTSGSAHPQATTSSNRRLRRTQSFKDLPTSHDGYSSHSSALTDDESKDMRLGRHGFEKIIRPVYSQKKRDAPTEDVGNGGLYEVMRQELRYAVEEIRTELNQAMGRNHTTLSGSCSSQADISETFQDSSGIRKKYSTKSEQLEKCKQDILNGMLLEEQGGRAKTGLPDSRPSSVVEKPSRARKRSNDRHRMSRKLTEEAEKYLEDFICNIEDTDISSFDGERSDGSSTLGGTRKPKESAIREAESYKSSAASNSCPGEMDGVIFPWLQWETSHDGSPSANTKTQTPITPIRLKWDLEMEMASLPDPSNNSASSRGTWSPALFNSQATKEDACLPGQSSEDHASSYYSEKYLNLTNDEELLFEIYRQYNRIESGRLLLCTSVLY